MTRDESAILAYWHEIQTGGVNVGKWIRMLYEVILQGITDAYAVTEDGIILWDYKTDRVPADGGEQRLIELYGIQMELYAEALSAALDKPVKEMFIYSFALDRIIRVPK